MGQKTKGKCKYCGKEYALAGINRHLSACKARKDHLLTVNKNRCGYYRLTITDKYNRDCWMVIEISETSILKDLDNFLRDIWLECCGHLSAFYIAGITYDVSPETDDFWGTPSKTMNCRLQKVLQKGMSFDYEYDFGSTTYLSITVTDYRVGGKEPEKITILSRNNPVVYSCECCGRPADVIDVIEQKFLCEECLAKREEPAEDLYYLNVCNSPRMGTCAYEGSEIYPDQFESDVERKKNC